MKKLRMKKNENKGILITFCGLDGCGKTTMINRFVSEFGDKFTIFTTKQPTDFVRKSSIFRTYMDCPEHDKYNYRSLSLLAASDRVQHSDKVINSELSKGKIVISDRYFYSCLANLRARGFKNDNWIYEISRFIIKPDISFFLDVPVETAILRVRARESERNSYIDTDLQYKLRHEYLNISEKNGGITVPADIPEDDSYEIIKKNIERIIKKNGYTK